MPRNLVDKSECDAQRALRKRSIMDKLKMDLGCVDCGYRENPAALEWDHLPGFEKTKNVASLLYRSWTAILEETDKCEVVCANCHAIRSAGRNWHTDITRIGRQSNGKERQAQEAAVRA